LDALTGPARLLEQNSLSGWYSFAFGVKIDSWESHKRRVLQCLDARRAVLSTFETRYTSIDNRQIDRDDLLLVSILHLQLTCAARVGRYAGSSEIRDQRPLQKDEQSLSRSG
jgi:hypothetical protein